MEKLKAKLHSLRTADREAIDLLTKLFVEVTFKKNWVISSKLTGFSAANLYYITDGLIRGNVSDGNEEGCLWVIDQGFIVPGNGFLTGCKRDESIEVLAETNGYSLNLLRADTIARDNVNLYRMLLEIYEEVLLQGRRREIMLRIKKAADRYNFFSENYPSLNRRLTIEQQALYLHIERKYLYRLKK